MSVQSDPIPLHHARDWLETILRQTLAPDLYASLGDGVLLCKLINRLWPGMIAKIDYGDSRSAKTENIQWFLRASRQLGLKSSELFLISDLLDDTDMDAVVRTILSLSRLAPMTVHRSLSGYSAFKDTNNAPLHQSTSFSNTQPVYTQPDDTLVYEPQLLLNQAMLSGKRSDNFHDDQPITVTHSDEISPHHNHLSSQDCLASSKHDSALDAHQVVPIYPSSAARLPLSKRDSLDSLPDEEEEEEEVESELIKPDAVRRRPYSPQYSSLASVPLDNDSRLSYGVDDTCSLYSNPQEHPKSSSSKSRDSGYGTGRGKRRTTVSAMPIQLASLFDPMVEKSSMHHTGTHGRQVSHASHASSSMDDTRRHRSSPTTPTGISAKPYSQPYNETDSVDMSVHTTISVESAPPTSRLARLSQMPFSKSSSLRSSTPFHIRYQEWTEKQTGKHILHRKASDSLLSSHPLQSLRGGRPISTYLSDFNQTSHSSPGFESQEDEDGKKRGKSLGHKLSKTKREWLASLRSHSSTASTDQDSIKKTEVERRAPVPSFYPEDDFGVPRRKSTGTMQKTSKNSSVSSCDEEHLELQDDTGLTVACYKLGNVIGKGQFGTVHRALDLVSGKMVAIKRITLDKSRKNDINDVMQEAELLQSLVHPNIVKYEGFIQNVDHINIVLEYVENGSLQTTLKSFGSFPENLVSSYCGRILEGLCYLHERDVVHCDLKAANILTTKSGDVKLSDFGVSLNLKLMETETGTVAGTPNWMSPEIIELKGASTKSDIWSLGCTIVELCTGKPPYAHLNPMTTLFRIVEDDCPPLPKDISDDLTDFLKLCFRKDPLDRPTASELMAHPWIQDMPPYRGHGSPTLSSSFAVIPEEGEAEDGPPSSTASSASRRAVSQPPQSKRSPKISSSSRNSTNSSGGSSVSASSNSSTSSRTVPRSFLPPVLNDIEPRTSQSTPYQDRNLPARHSVLADKFQKRHADEAPKPPLYRDHHFVKGSFRKGVVRCRACQLPIKKDALVCDDCGFICHQKCKNDALCISTTKQESHLLPPKPRESPRPSSSVSSQLRQHSRKISRVFTSVVRHNEHPMAATEPPMSWASADGRHARRRPSNPDECIIS